MKVGYCRTSTAEQQAGFEAQQRRRTRYWPVRPPSPDAFGADRTSLGENKTTLFNLGYGRNRGVTRRAALIPFD
jgi:hypothetical protein